MNDLQQDPDLSMEQRARASNDRERADYQANLDYQGFKELKKSDAFNQVFLRRIQMKRKSRESSIIQGVSFEKYQVLVAEVKLLKEIEQMTDVERTNAWRHLHPNQETSEPAD